VLHLSKARWNRLKCIELGIFILKKGRNRIGSGGLHAIVRVNWKSFFMLSLSYTSII
jgi:hypothetical protein